MLNFKSSTKDTIKESEVAMDESSFKSGFQGGFRKQYQQQGVDQFYSNNGENYRNPHEYFIHKLVDSILDPRKEKSWYNQHFSKTLTQEKATEDTKEIKSKAQEEQNTDVIAKDYNLQTDFQIFDLACGSGEMTVALNKLGYQNIVATDPYTYQAYSKRIGQAALSLSFIDISDGKLEQKFDLIICSYALHLVKESLLPLLCLQLSYMAKWFIIIAPHQNPDIQSDSGWVETENIVYERIHARLFQSYNYE